MSASIHPTAIIHSSVQMGDNVHVGPYCVLGEGGVVLENSVQLKSHVCVEGDIRIGENTVVYPFASLGQPNQDLKYNGEPSKTRIGSNNTIREYVTIQRGTVGGRMETTVGNNCLLMVGSHVAHDCIVGDHVVMANYATLAGHVTVDDHVIIGGLSAVQQFVRIGAHAMIGGMSGVEKDVIPYGIVMGERASLHGLNLVGLRRRGFSNKTIQELMRLYDMFFEQESAVPLTERVAANLEAYKNEEHVMTLLTFLNDASKRSYCMPKK